MAGTIGIKLANGDFYSIMEGNSTVKKRLVLTTVHDGQESVQIDLFRSDSKSMLDAQYIGTLLVENIKSRLKGQPSIEMIISSGADGNITATARDLDIDSGGDQQTLNVSLKTIEPSGRKKTTNFDLEGHSMTSFYEEEERRKSPLLIILLAMLFAIIVGGLLWFFFLGGIDMFPAIRDQFAAGGTTQQPQPIDWPPKYNDPPPKPAAPPEPPPVIEEPKIVEPPPVIQAPAEPPPVRPQAVTPRDRPPAPVSSYKVPAVIPKEGVAYRIRWGDTLWDISEAFYRNPWLYTRIARYNNISNPDHIISGRTIRIPPRN